MSLPVADAERVRRHAWLLVRTHHAELVSALLLHGLAAAAGLVGPWVLGRIIDSLGAGAATRTTVGAAGLALLVAILLQAVLIRYAQKRSMVLGETVFAELREDFMATVSHLPLSTVEQAGTGDLLSRTTNDVQNIAHSVRFGVPRVLVALTTALVTAVAAILTSPGVALGLFVGVPLLVLTSRWYLRRAPVRYQRQLASYAILNGAVSETAEGAATVQALSLEPARRRSIDRALRERRESEMRTLDLRSIWLPATNLAFGLPVVVVVAWGAHLVDQGVATVGQVTAVALFAIQLMGPIEELSSWMDQIQVGATSLARLIGVEMIPPDRTASDREPADEHVVVRDVRYSYVPGVEVLHGIDLDLAVGERLALVGASGAGKSTLGRLLAGIHGPSSGSVTVGGVPLVQLPLETLRGHVALVTQEHHVFVGTLAENLRLAAMDATDADLERALHVVDAEWALALPDGLSTEVGSGGLALTPAQAQQVALARLVLLDPHTVVLDEATSLVDPSAARHLERSIDAVLTGRTVVAIAHRLHTAHAADRVAVVDGGRIVELGSHDELVRADGDYARLWRSWQSV